MTAGETIMAGSLGELRSDSDGDGDGDHNEAALQSFQKRQKPRIKQGAPNLTGHIYRCACCLKQGPPFLPDNCTLIPVCPECWAKIGISNRLMVVVYARNTKAVEGLMTLVQELVSMASQRRE